MKTLIIIGILVSGTQFSEPMPEQSCRDVVAAIEFGIEVGAVLESGEVGIIREARCIEQAEPQEAL